MFTATGTSSRDFKMPAVSHGDEICWFCQIHKADYFFSETMIGNINNSPRGGLEKCWNEIEISIPYCSSCKSQWDKIHDEFLKRTDKSSLLIPVICIGGICGGMLGGIYMYSEEGSYIWASIFGCLCALFSVAGTTILACIVKLIISSLNPSHIAAKIVWRDHEQKVKDQKRKYPEIVRMLAQGWAFKYY